MSDLHHNKGFTLVEIVAALGAFSIAFLSGFAAIGALMIRQDINYRSTVAASAAMILGRKNGTMLTYNSEFETAYMNAIPAFAGCKFRGYPVVPIDGITMSALGLTDSVATWTFKVGATPSFAEYRAIIMTKHGKGIAFWYGAPEELEASRATTLDYLGVYKVAP